MVYSKHSAGNSLLEPTYISHPHLRPVIQIEFAVDYWVNVPINGEAP